MKVKILIILILCCRFGMAQIEIVDEGMRACLMQDYPSLLMNNDQLDTNKSKQVNYLNCSGYEIEKFELVEYFTNLKELNLSENDISDISFVTQLNDLEKLFINDNEIKNVPDLQGLDELEFVNFNYNLLTKFPSLPSSVNNMTMSNNKISGSIDLSKFEDLEQFFFGNNNISSITGYQNLLKLKKIGVGGNKLTYLEPLTNLENLEALYASNNKLTEVVGLSNKSELEILYLSSNLFTELPEIDLSNHPNVQLYHNLFTFEDILALGDETLLNSLGVGFDPQMTRDFVEVSTHYTEGSSLFLEIDWDESSNNTYYLWYKDDVLLDSTDSPVYEVSSVTIDDEGVYSCSARNIDLKNFTIKVNPITVVILPAVDESEPLVITPDGDGQADAYFLETSGWLNIYNRQGQIVQSLQGPTSWDGTNYSGEVLPVGVYVIKKEDQLLHQITIIK